MNNLVLHSIGIGVRVSLYMRKLGEKTLGIMSVKNGKCKLIQPSRIAKLYTVHDT